MSGSRRGPRWISRRNALRLATGTGLSLLGVPVLAGCSGRATTRVSMVPDQADALVDAFGVVTHFHFGTSGYAQVDRVVPVLADLGVRHVRNRLSPQPDVLDAFEQLGDLGIRVHAVCGAREDRSESMAELMRLVVARFPDPLAVFSAFEGINEPNNDGVPWVADTRGRTRQLRRARDARGLEAIPIVAPALARVSGGGISGADTYEQAGALGDLTDAVDVGNIHVYPRGLQPSQDIDYFVRCAERVSPGLPIMCTEGGYFTAEDYEGGAFAVPRAVAAAYTPQMLLEHWRAGHRRFFRYELLDDPGAQAERESSFGMVEVVEPDSTGPPSPKPDFVAMQRLITIFSDPGEPFEPRPVSYEIEGPDDLRSAVFARRDGGVLLCLWLDRPVYDTRARVLQGRLTEPYDVVNVTLGADRDVVVESLVRPGDELARGTTSTVEIELPAGVTVITLR